MMMNALRKMMVWLVVWLAGQGAFAQWKWMDPMEGARQGVSYLQGQGWNEDGGNYLRFPLRAQETIRADVWRLAGQSAGLSVRFCTDARDIRVKYVVTGALNMPHMPSTGVSGVDLYRVADGTFCFGSYAFGDTVRYQYHVDPLPSSEGVTEYELFLPLYNGVKSLQIGVGADSEFSFVQKDKRMPVVVYGTSIAQGACASRPGMAWVNILHRSLQHPVVNLGFSGNGRLEPAVIDLLNELEAAVYVIDCMPNMNQSTKEEVCDKVVKAVRQIRSRHQTPILLVEHAGYSNAPTNQEREELYTRHNEGQREAYRLLKEQGVGQLFYLSHEELAYAPDAWVDYVHPSDWGMVRQAQMVESCLRKILLPGE